MEQKTVTDFINACMKAKRFTTLMPELPAGMSPKHILALGAIYDLSRTREEIKISDVAEQVETTRPSVTKLIQYLEGIGAVEKTQSGEDKRMFSVRLTEVGLRYHEKFALEYHRHLRNLFEEISETDMQTATRVILEAYEIMRADKLKGTASGSAVMDAAGASEGGQYGI